MTETRCDVLVVGAGPTGLALACELARWGVRVQVVDAAAEPFAGSRGKGLQPRSLEVLHGLGVAGRLVAGGRFRIPLRRYDASGAHQDHDLHPDAEPSPDVPYARSLLIPQWRVEGVLRERLAEHGVTVRFGTQVTGLDQRPDGVRVRCEDGSALTADYLVGCDGGSSTVRRALGVSFLGETREEIAMLLGDVVLDGLDRDHWHIWSNPPAPYLALCPLPATDTFQLQAQTRSSGEEPSLETFQAIVDEAVGGSGVAGNSPAGPVRLRRATWLSRWRLNVRMVDRYRVGRVFLAGDAAHVHSPAGGQGMNTGIQDAANLGWKLAHVLAGADPALLDSYEAERMPVAADVLGLSTRLSGRAMEQRGADGVQALQLGVHYRGGPLAGPGAGTGAGTGTGGGPEPGDRAPDAPCRDRDGRRVRLFDLQAGPHWTLLAFGASPVPPAGAVRVVRIGEDVLDADGHAGRAYRAEPGELVLVRPDGHIGARSTGIAEIERYLDAVLPPARPAPDAVGTSADRADR